MDKLLEESETSLHFDKEYSAFLISIKDRLKRAQLRAAQAANTELVVFYWELGTDLLNKQKMYKWGEHFLDQFSHDMRTSFPGMKGFSKRSLQRMKQFAEQYPNLLIAPQAVAQLPWGHISLLIHTVKDHSVREWYAVQTLKNGWSRSILEMQIDTNLFERQGISTVKTANFHDLLAPSQSNLAHEILKDPYHFDFLTISEDAHERDIENALVTHVRNFLLELGQGFAFVGSQVPFTIDEQEFFIDLLFYHLHLRCYVVIELKANNFKPEHTGQLGFYLAAVDDLMKKESDNPSIGMLLCKSKSKLVAEYALRSMNAPIGISEYQLSKALPKELKSNLPSIEQIELELNDRSK